MRSFLLPILLAAAAPAVAQPGATVEPAELRAFVDGVTVQAEGQVARFYEPVCVVSEGLPADYNAVVEQRVRELAGAAGIAVSRGGGCLPNFIVLVADDSADLAAVLRRRRPEIFAGMDSAQISRVVAAAAGPVRSWQSSEATWAYGEPVLDRRDEYLGRDVHLLHGVPAGLLRQTTRRALRLSVVVFDLAAVDGLSLMQIADHAAMRGLAPTRPAEAAAGRSILSLFDQPPDQRDALPAVTRLDLAYLRALYRIGGAVSAGMHRSLLARLVERNLNTSDR